MVNPPEYQRQTGITPAASPQGFDVALKQVGESNIIGELGRQISQNASNEQARLAGLEAGKTPGRTLLPAITQSDAEFTKAYKAQEYAIASRNGKNFLDRLTFNTLKNPDANALAQYDEINAQAIDELVAPLSRDTAEVVREQLSAQALVGRYHIEEQVVKREKHFLAENMQQAYEESVKSINDLMEAKDYQSAQKLYEKTVEFIDDPIVNPDLSDSARNNLKKVLRQTMENAAYRDEMVTAIRDGKAEELLAQIAGEPQTAENMQKAQTFYDTYKNYRAMTAAHDDLLTSGIEKKIAEQSLKPTDLIAIKDQISKPKYADIEVKAAKYFAAQQEQESVFNYFQTNANNGIALSSLSGAQLDKAFNRQVQESAQRLGVAPSLEFEAQIAKNIDIPIPGFNNRIERGIKSANPDTSIAASNIYASMAKSNADTVSGVDNKAAMKAAMISDQMLTGTPALDAWKYAADKIDNLTPNQIEERKSLFKEELNTRSLKAPSRQKFAIYQKMDFSHVDKDKIPPGLLTDFMGAVERNYTIGGDWDASFDMAADQLKQIYTETDVNGFWQVMYLAPDKQLPTSVVKEDLRNQMATLFEKQRIEFDKADSETPFYYQIDENQVAKFTITGQGIGQVHQKRELYQPIRAIKVDRSGAEIKGAIIISPDRFTPTPAPGQGLSYSVNFLPDGKLIGNPVYEPDEWSNARFAISSEAINNYNNSVKQKQIELDELAQKRIAQLYQELNYYKGYPQK